MDKLFLTVLTFPVISGCRQIHSSLTVFYGGWCISIGCDNGLRYHKRHDDINQRCQNASDHKAILQGDPGFT